jgi:hypothetical protein
MKSRTPEEIKQDMIANHKAMGDHINDHGLQFKAVQMALNYKIVYHTAELAEVSSHKVEVLTRWRVGCTVALIVLTVVLTWFTWELVQHGH